MNEKLLDVLACPSCIAPLDMGCDALVCPQCERTFPIEEGIVHFVRDEDRPANPTNLAKVEGIQDPKTYERHARENEQRYATDAHVREYVDSIADFAAPRQGVVVDLATGPGGGYVAPLLKRMSPECLLIATDACLPVVAHQYRLFKPRYGDQFEMLDVDLAGTLPFQSASIDAFCGLLITNISGVSNTLRDMVRCLKDDGQVVLGERFYAQESVTARHLREQGHVFASFGSFKDYAHGIGLQVSRFQKLFSTKGKTDPRDGLPLDEQDEWFWCHLYLEKQAERSS